MKLFLFFIFGISILSCKEDKVFKANLKRQHNKSIFSLNGKVKTLADNIYVFIDNDTLKILFKSKNVYLFDSIGNLIDEIDFKDSIKPYAKSNYKFDKYSNLVEIINNSENSKSFTKYIVERNGSIRSKTIDESLTSNKITYTNLEYDDNFNLVLETIQIANKEKIIKKYKHIFDKNGNSIEINISEVLLFKNKPIAKNVCTFDDKNRELEKTSFLYEDDITTKSFSEYHGSNLISYTNIDYKGKVSKHSFKYDSVGNMTESKRFDEDSHVSKYSEKYKYIYDKYNNWIERMEFDVNNKPSLIHKRTILYY